MEIVIPKKNEKSGFDVLKLESQSLVIIGANGSGKSKFGAWVEKQQHSKIHRIGAQRALSIGEYIQQRSYEQATNLLMNGSDKHSNNHDSRWGNWDGIQFGYTTSMLNDFDFALSALLALRTTEQERYIIECKDREKENLQHEAVPEMADEKLLRIWKKIFPQREVKIQDGKVIACGILEGKVNEYKGKEMSDGERVALYLIAQALCIPSEKIIIIDEPEIHLHRSILNNLWNEIEKERSDCTFIYITHDTQFASSCIKAKKIWIKSFDGEKWEYEFIDTNNMPEQLLLDILGNRKPVIFVEGLNESKDTKLYSEIYRDFYIVPTGSCTSVITFTKSMRNNAQLHHLKCFGIIDRDFRTEYEINKYKEDGVFTLKVAEVENLFLVEELLLLVNSILKFQDNDRVNKIIRHIIDDVYSNQIQRQICESVVAELKYKLSVITISNKNEEDAKETIQNISNTLDYDSIKIEQSAKYVKALNDRDYRKILELLNCKSLVKYAGSNFGLDNKEYTNFIIRHLTSENRDLIINALSTYLPEEIQIN